jgi:two-component system response regulator MprA
MRNVLVVDDQASNLVGLSRILAFLGFEPTTATNGVEALAALRAHGADLVLLDISMPVMGGFETLSTIRADPQLNAVPVLMVSGTDDETQIDRCRELGASGFLLKPFTFDELEQKLRALDEAAE